MNVHDLYEAICQLDDEILQKSEQYSKPRRSFDTRWLAPVGLVAAMLALILCVPLLQSRGLGNDAPEAAAPAAPEAPEAEAPGAPLAPPEMEGEGETWYYNDGQVEIWAHSDPIGYERYDLSDDLLAQLVPAELMEDADVTGWAGYDAEGNLVDAQFQFGYEIDGPIEITLTVFRPWKTLGYAGSGKPDISNRKGTEFVLYHGSGYGIDGGKKFLSADVTFGGAECVFLMDSSRISVEKMKAVFESVLESFAGSEYPDLSVLESWQPGNEE